MKLCSGCQLEKPFSDFHRKRAHPEGTLSGYAHHCKACASARKQRWYAENRDKAIAYTAAWCQANPDAKRAYRTAHYQRNADKRREWQRAHSAKPEVKAQRNIKRREWRDRNRARDCEYTKKWQAKNKSLVNAISRTRKASKLRATPPWAMAGLNKFLVEETYAMAAMRSEITGVAHHVDHIVPLRGKIVSGLHVPANLRIVAARENQRKSNRWWPDMPAAA